MVASKFLHDEGEAEEIFNEEWAEAGMSLLLARIFFAIIAFILVSGVYGKRRLRGVFKAPFRGVWILHSADIQLLICCPFPTKFFPKS